MWRWRNAETKSKQTTQCLQFLYCLQHSKFCVGAGLVFHSPLWYTTSRKRVRALDENILAVNGLSIDFLTQLSYRSQLGLSLKGTLRHFDRDALIDELNKMTEWLDEQDALSEIALDYRIKSYASIVSKYERYLDSSHHVSQVFNDILGFRTFCDNYDDVLALKSSLFSIADLSRGKASDDGYRGVHLYFQLDNEHYPIEIQYNTLYDRQLNNWLHDYLYKKSYPDQIGRQLRIQYEQGKIRNVKEFEKVLHDVLSDS